MKVLKALTTEQANAESKEIMNNIQQKLGRVPNLYATMANSSQLLGGYIAFEASLKSGSFSTKENEVIALSVSQSNGCNYCLAAHSALAKMAGFSEAEVINIRKGTADNPKLKALATLATEITNNKGKTSDDAVNNFFAQGYTHQSLAELIGMVAIRNITNYIYTNGNFEIDFPKATDLEEVATTA